MMCSYTTSTGTKDVEETDADSNVTTVTKVCSVCECHTEIVQRYDFGLWI